MKVSVSAAKLMVPHYEFDAPLDQLAVVLKLPGGSLLRDDVPCVESELRGDLVPSPFMAPRVRQWTSMIRDLASSFVRENSEIDYEDLLGRVKADAMVSNAIEASLIDEFVDECLRMIIANKGFKVSKKKSKYMLELGPVNKVREKERTFAASLAEEIGALSDRMAAVVPHLGEQGRFREDLFRAVLEKHLPTRYHVATGFIEGCPRQLDILIYDQVDYIPVFREAGVVVIPPEAVRAVIEVKTTLSAEEVNDALGKIADVAEFDDCAPPFFKGVFAYRGPIKEDTVTNYILDYYRKEPHILCKDEKPTGDDAPIKEVSEQDLKNDKEQLCFQQIHAPFKHLTALCVDRSYFAEVLVELNSSNNRHLMTPTIQVVGSKTDLTPQTALFVEALNEHLSLQTIKKRAPGMFRSRLASDLQVIDKKPIYENDWGPYFEVSFAGKDEKNVTEEIQRQAGRVERWRLGDDWSSIK